MGPLGPIASGHGDVMLGICDLVIVAGLGLLVLGIVETVEEFLNL